MRIAAVVTAAGSGSRLGADVPKALVPLSGRALVAWAVLGIADACDEIVVTAPQSHLAEVTAALASLELSHTPVRVIAGGAQRQQSVAAGLEALFDERAPTPDVVLVHDAARAFQAPSVIRSAIAAVIDGAAGAIPLVPVVDTLVSAPDEDGTLGETVDREGLRAVQTPQVFRSEILRAAHLAYAESAATDDAQLVRASGGRVVAVDGHESGFKVTVQADLPLAEYYASQLRGARPPAREQS